jgi:hypothetical protein
VPEAINKTVSFGPEPAAWPKRTLGNDSKAAQTNPAAIRLKIECIMRHVSGACELGAFRLAKASKSTFLVLLFAFMTRMIQEQKLNQSRSILTFFTTSLHRA